LQPLSTSSGDVKDRRIQRRNKMDDKTTASSFSDAGGSGGNVSFSIVNILRDRPAERTSIESSHCSGKSFIQNVIRFHFLYAPPDNLK